MLEIKITGETPLEALASLTAFGMHCMTNNTVTAAANRILAAERAMEAQAAQVSNSDTPVQPPEAMTAEEGKAMVDAARNFDPRTASPAEPYVEESPHGDPTPENEPEGTWEPGGGEAVEEDGAPTYTLEQIRTRGTEAARTHGTPAVKAILTELGAKGMGTLDKSKYSAFVAKLDALDKAKAGDPDA